MLRLTTSELFKMDDEMMEPLDSIAESVAPAEAEVVDVVPQQLFQLNQPGFAGNLPPSFGLPHEQPQPGPGINLRLTAAGVRGVLARKIRSKPLLKIICKGCGLSTHDKDIFIPSDCLECLGCMSDMQSRHSTDLVPQILNTRTAPH